MAAQPEDLPEGREDLYREVEAGKLVGSYNKVARAIEAQAGKAEEYPSTPYTAQNSENMHSTALALRELGDEPRAWHEFLHPRKQ